MKFEGWGPGVLDPTSAGPLSAEDSRSGARSGRTSPNAGPETRTATLGGWPEVETLMLCEENLTHPGGVMQLLSLLRRVALARVLFSNE